LEKGQADKEGCKVVVLVAVSGVTRAIMQVHTPVHDTFRKGTYKLAQSCLVKRQKTIIVMSKPKWSGAEDDLPAVWIPQCIVAVVALYPCASGNYGNRT
jgi:hypothetical protein